MLFILLYVSSLCLTVLNYALRIHFMTQPNKIKQFTRLVVYTANFPVLTIQICLFKSPMCIVMFDMHMSDWLRLYLTYSFHDTAPVKARAVRTTARSTTRPSRVGQRQGAWNNPSANILYGHNNVTSFRWIPTAELQCIIITCYVCYM